MNYRLEKTVASDEDSPVMRAIIEAQAQVFAAAYAVHLAAGHGSTMSVDRANNAMRAFYNEVQVPDRAE